MKNHKNVKAQIETDEEDKVYNNNIIIDRKVEPTYFHDVEEFIRETIKQWCKLEEKRIGVQENETNNM